MDSQINKGRLKILFNFVKAPKDFHSTREYTDSLCDRDGPESGTYKLRGDGPQGSAHQDRKTLQSSRPQPQPLCP